MSRRPVLFLDVDGTLLPAGGRQRPTTLEDWYAQWQSAANPYLATLVSGLGPRLRALRCDLVWATAWMDDANTIIAPLMGLPHLPVADLGPLPGIDDPVFAETDPAAGPHWKTRPLVRLAAGRPLVWLDDEITDTDRTWVRTHHRGAALLLRPVADRGLSATDLDAVESWLRAL